MDLNEKIVIYQKKLTDYLESLATEYNNSLGTQLEYQAIADTVRGHFQLLKLGWHERRYYHIVLLHFDVKPTGKVWIQLNDTEILIADELVKCGIPASDIVLGFKPEYMRPHTGYAAA